jgi:hypothetical protein
VDDSIFIRRPEPDDEVWSNGSAVNPGAFTTGRRRPAPPPIKPRSQVRPLLTVAQQLKVQVRGGPYVRDTLGCKFFLNMALFKYSIAFKLIHFSNLI